MKQFKINLTGRIIGRLIVLEYVDDGYWKCRCTCGNIVTIFGACLRRQTTKSCGCLKREGGKPPIIIKHGQSYDREYRAWIGAKSRCLNPNNLSYFRYGGRGIMMCQEWQNSFEIFFHDMGPCPNGMSLDRRNNDLGYFPNNCRWATRTEQNNNRRGQQNITYKGQTLNMMQWAKRLGINHGTLRNRIFRSHWPIEKAFACPIHSAVSKSH